MLPTDPSRDVFLELFHSIPEPPFEVFNPKNNQVIAVVTQNGFVIQDPGIKKRVYTLGVNIPPFLKERFSEKIVIRRTDPSFYEAFITAECLHLLRSAYKIRPCADPLST
jgi:hypothetical protein